VILLIIEAVRHSRRIPPVTALFPSVFWSLSAAAAAASAYNLPVLFLTFLKKGAALYGSGYVLLAFLRAVSRGV